MKKIYFLLLFFGALLFCACEKETADLLLDDPATTQVEDGVLKGAKKHMIPFKGQFVNWDREATDLPAPDPPAVLRLYFDGEGYATHLGKTIQFQDQQWVFGSVEGVGWGTMILTAANGDELWSTYTSSFPYSTSIITGHGEFTGGTGRFEDATGTFTLVETYDMENNLGTSTYTGTIMY
jgi:hypothetical protein